MKFFSKVSSLILVSGLVASSLATVTTFAVAQNSTTNNTQSSQTEMSSEMSKAKTELKNAKSAVKTARTEVKKAKINHKLEKAENIYASLIKKAEAKNLDTTKIKADVETLKSAELKLKTDLDTDATKDVLTADRAAIKTALTAVKADVKALRAELAKK